MKKSILKWLLPLLLFPILIYSDLTGLPAPYNQVDLMGFDGDGFYVNEEDIKDIFSKNTIQTGIEVGCWLGASTRHIASLLPQGGKLYAVDHFLGSEEHQNNGRIHRLYRQFLSNVIHAGLTDKIIPVKMYSLEAAQYLSNITADFIYIDAGHKTEDVLADLRAWYPRVREQGVFCGDDWEWPSVRAAVQIFAEERNLIIESRVNFWRLIKPTQNSEDKSASL